MPWHSLTHSQIYAIVGLGGFSPHLVPLKVAVGLRDFKGYFYRQMNSQCLYGVKFLFRSRQQSLGAEKIINNINS